MNSLGKARKLFVAGRFAAALATLDDATAGGEGRVAREVLRAELLERTGKPEQSRSTIAWVMRSREATQTERSTCEFVLSRIES